MASSQRPRALPCLLFEVRRTRQEYPSARAKLVIPKPFSFFTTLVAIAEDGVIGWAQLLPWRQRGYEVVEDLVYVDPVYQKKGVGRELLTRTIEAARSTGCKTIVASVAADNGAGLRLHQSLGFEVVGTLKNAAYKFGRWMDVTLVQRAI